MERRRKFEEEVEESKVLEIHTSPIKERKIHMIKRTIAPKPAEESKKKEETPEEKKIIEV